MATGGAVNVPVGEYDECPVCRDCLRDPRTLDCGHYFCRICLQGIIRENPQCSVNCPTCWEVTKLVEGSGVTDLPRHEGRYSLQDQVAEFLSMAKRQDVVRYCDFCPDKMVTAIRHCTRCITNLCAECFNVHQEKAASHRTVPMSDSIYCAAHPEQTVTDDCQDCARNICIHCVFNEHKEHQTVDIEAVATPSRDRLSGFLENQSTTEKDEFTLKGIQSTLEKARQMDTELTESVATTRKLIKELEAKLDQVEQDTKGGLAAAIKTLTMYEWDTNDTISSKQSLAEHATYLTEQASDPELVNQEREFPITKIVDAQNIDADLVEHPVLDNVFQSACYRLQEIATDIKVEFIDRKKQIEDLKKEQTVQVTHWIGGITLYTKRKRLVARTNDVNGPLKLYSYTGQLQESLGAGVAGLADGNHRGICMDTKRDVYIALFQNTVMFVDRAGQLNKSIPVGSDNYGVAYHKEGDCYLVSDSTKHTVYLIDPDTSQVTRQIGSQGSGPTQFSYPYHIHCGTVTGADNPCILVSDYSNHCIKVFDISGTHVKTYGSRGAGDKQFNCQRGVTTDPRGRVIVADQSNNRVTSHWVDPAGTEQWECVLHNDWGGYYPFHLALDTTHMVMVVGDTSNKTLHIYN